MDYRKPTDQEFKDIMDSFWVLMRECESKAHYHNDTILKHWVEGYYEQWNSVTGQNHKPMWKK